jgi:hypothetical protein
MMMMVVVVVGVVAADVVKLPMCITGSNKL